MTDVSLTLEQAQTILAIKLSKGRPSAEVSALRALAKRVINAHRDCRVEQGQEEIPAEQEILSEVEEKIYEPLNIEIPAKELAPEGISTLAELDRIVSSEYQKLFDRYPAEMTQTHWSEWKSAKDLLLSGWAMQRDNILKAHLR